MNTFRKNAIIVGILFIIATVFLFIGKAVYEPILESTDYLDIAYPNRITAVAGMLLEFACVLSIPLIPVFLFPVLRKYNEPFALGYAVFRFFEAVLFVLIEINKLSLINVSQNFLNNAGMDTFNFQNLGSAIQSWNSWAFSFYLLLFTIGAMLFYSVLYSSKLVPRFISAWGFIAAILLFIGSIMNLLEVNIMSSGMLFEVVFAMPIAVNEMVLAVWLIVKGYNPSAITTGQEK